MNFLFAFTLLLGAALAIPEIFEDDDARNAGVTCSCGWVNRGRIVGGQQTRRNEYPYMVALQNRRGSQFCGGTILTPWHVVSAAHCTINSVPSNLFVNVGAHVLGAQSEGVYAIARIINHPNYNTRTLHNDISLLVTQNQIRFNQNVGPSCFPTRPLSIAGRQIKALGWGLTTDKGSSSNVLREVDLTVISNAECARSWSNLRANMHLCTFERNKDTCQGDSGGPLLYLDPAINRYTLAALTSYGGPCAGGRPGVNADVSGYVSWINGLVQSTKPGTRTCTRRA